jgi:5-keto 4-deoxyuronate isomerase|tara:strand:+ start:1335 stop:1757 length:423 start_codon:yes stop_codon:yes gene_type:complete
MSKINKLQTLSSTDIGLFTLKNRQALGKVVHITTPNSCQIILGLNNLIFKFNCKLRNTIENNSSTNESLSKLVCGSDDIINNQTIMKVICYDFDIDGNLLVDLFDLNCDESCINNVLIASGNLSPYKHNDAELFQFNLNN